MTTTDKKKPGKGGKACTLCDSVMHVAEDCPYADNPTPLLARLMTGAP